MVEQIVIKLNKKKFKPLLDNLQNFGPPTRTYSEKTAHIIFMMHLLAHEKYKDDKTMAQHILDIARMNREEFILHFQKKYVSFLKTGLK